MPRKTARAFNFNAIVKYSYMDVIFDRIVPVNDRICNNLMKRLVGVSDRFQVSILDSLDKSRRKGDGVNDLPICRTFDNIRLAADQNIPYTFGGIRRVTVHNYRSFGKNNLRLIRI
ncbi:hypothetical protein FF36_05669 [Frankia torreyi]|uniref:Uncharacterized protein n=1 Tax=Frankia torreyi TaxID=1856 RepID=A0A0D8B6Z8_9ACTN|nr:hypothetical protein FF36_05669 [Frankia torreyi]KQM02341.1 hypothetical protein FF86_10703 [Frankia sp. CpI1-P]